MGLLQLQHFKALAERGHLTQTAKELMISGPYLSASIARLEEKIGCKLFDRDGRNIRLNKAGEVYLGYTNSILAMLENARLEALEISGQQKRQLSVAISSPMVWLDLMQSFVKKHPDILLSHSLIRHDKLKDANFCSKFDFIFASTTDMQLDGWTCDMLIADDKPIFAVYPGHRFARRKSVKMIEAKDEKFIVVQKKFSVRKFFEDTCQAAGFIPKIAIECDYMLRPTMLAAKVGIIFTTKSGAMGSTIPNAIFVPISDPPLPRTQGFFSNKQNYASQVSRLFRDFILQSTKGGNLT